MIANDALELGKTIFKIKEGIKELQKEINKNEYDIDNMTLENAAEYLVCSCGNCLFPEDLEDEDAIEAILDAIQRAKFHLKTN